MKTVTVATMSLERVTKGAVLYKNRSPEDGEPITNLYLRKSGLSEPYPTTIHVTVEVNGES